jgi:GntR family transcriptional regulator
MLRTAQRSQPGYIGHSIASCSLAQSLTRSSYVSCWVMSATSGDVGNVNACQATFTMIAMSLSDKRGRINHRTPRLLWQQVADDLRAEMDSSELVEDARLPGELELADQYGVSRDTIRRAIQELVSEGRLVVLHGRGTFVTPKS